MKYVYKSELVYSSQIEAFKNFENRYIGEIVTMQQLKPASYTLNIKHLYWDDYRLADEIEKCRVDMCLYKNLKEKPNTQFISREELIDWAKSIKPYDIEVEIINRSE